MDSAVSHILNVHPGVTLVPTLCERKHQSSGAWQGDHPSHYHGDGSIERILTPRLGEFSGESMAGDFSCTPQQVSSVLQFLFQFSLSFRG